jgi:hypothetical protein
LTEGREHHDGRNALTGNLLGRADPIKLWHLDIHDHKIGRDIPGQRYRRFPVTGLADYLIALLSEHLHQIQADQHLVLGHDDPSPCAVNLVGFCSHGDTLARCLSPPLGI